MPLKSILFCVQLLCLCLPLPVDAQRHASQKINPTGQKIAIGFGCYKVSVRKTSPNELENAQLKHQIFETIVDENDLILTPNHYHFIHTFTGFDSSNATQRLVVLGQKIRPDSLVIWLYDLEKKQRLPNYMPLVGYTPNTYNALYFDGYFTLIFKNQLLNTTTAKVQKSFDGIEKNIQCFVKNGYFDRIIRFEECGLIGYMNKLGTVLIPPSTVFRGMNLILIENDQAVFEHEKGSRMLFDIPTQTFIK